MTKKAKSTGAKKRKLLAIGGGNATASGVTFQGSVAAYFASQGLAEVPLDVRLGLGSAKLTGFRFETEAPVDDILISFDTSGWAFIQAKNSLTNSASLASALGKTCDELARLWEVTSEDSGAHGWDRPLQAGMDVMVIAVGPTTSGTIKEHLARALDGARNGSLATLSQVQRNALASFRTLIGKALAARGGTMAGVDPNAILQFVHILEFDFGGPHRTSAEAVLSSALTNHSSAPAALAVLERECEKRMATRKGINLAGLRTELARGGIPLNGPRNYRSDIAALRDRTSRVAKALDDFAHTRVSGIAVTIPRSCTAACVAAAKDGSLVVVGDPGAGKSAVIKETAQQLGDDGSDVVLLAVDRLQVESAEGLSAALGISHPLADVLANWPGSTPAYLILDALDACRFGKSEALFRVVMQEVLALDEGRWRIVASIRTFDLMVGQEFKRLFAGVAPNLSFTDPRFQTARHVRVPEWTDMEFEALLTKIPALRVAIDNGGPKFAELARVPFNTRLLADLLTAGVVPEKLRHLGSQVQLLEMYWDERVRPGGASAEQCLSSTVDAMVDHGRMEVTRIVAGAATGNALDQLLQRGVLISVNGDHDVAFRHHILFDYAASRTIIDLDNAPKTGALLKRAGASLLLAPALSFTLQHLWETSGQGRERFWQAICRFAGDAASDAVVRSVAARVACELSSAGSDTAGLCRLMGHAAESEKAFEAFRQIVGALTVRFEDDKDVPLAAWCSTAEASAAFVTKTAWTLRTLIHNLIDRTIAPEMRRQIGVASRAIMDHAFDAPGGGSLMQSVIGFVAMTFGTDPAASRRLVERLLNADRMKVHAANEMLWLANHVGHIAPHDTDLVVQIYDRIFAHSIEDNAPTNLGSSKILALTSNRRQDFKMSQWRLKEAFPTFAKTHPLAAAEVAIKVSSGYIQNEHKLPELPRTMTMQIGTQVGRLTEDYSFIWAARHRAKHADDAAQIIDGFVEMLETASDTDAVAMADLLITENKHGWLWNRLLVVAHRRGGALAAKLWPWAAQVELLSSRDTMKPAIDLLGAHYSQRSPTERCDVERKVMAARFPTADEPARSAQYFQRRVLGFIGKHALETDAARDVVDEAVANDAVVLNNHDYRASEAAFVEQEEHGWLRAKGVDIEAEPNASILTAVTACPSINSAAAHELETAMAAVWALRDKLIGSGATPHPLVAAHGWERLASTIERKTTDEALTTGLTVAERTEIGQLLKSLRPALACHSGPGEGMWKRARANAAGAIMNIVWCAPEAAASFEEDIRAFAIDEEPAVRSEIAGRLGHLWKADKNLLWSLAEGFASKEINARVLARLVGFLMHVSNFEPKRVCTLTQMISRSDITENTGDQESLCEGIGTLVFHLWTRHSELAAREIIDRWLKDRSTSKSQLQHGAFALRCGLVIGYDSDNAAEREIRIRCQQLAFDVIDLSARGIEDYVALDRANQTDGRSAEASDDAALLDQMSDQFFYAVGAIEVRKGEKPRTLEKIDHRRRYLADNEKTFRRVGDVGIPSTIYNMLQLLEFLTPGGPAMVFDLTSHALLRAGKLHGYQSEAMGADQFVKMIGQTIADHRDLFDDPVRRLKLVEVLEAFVNVGWPAARRLLYRLPEALR